MTPNGRFTVRLPDGVLVERLPIGRAAGQLWFTFVLSGIEPERLGFGFEFPEVLNEETVLNVDDPDESGSRPDFYGEVTAMFAVSSDGRPLGLIHMSGGGNHDGYQHQIAFHDTGETTIDVVYMFEGREYAREVLELASQDERR